MSDARAREITLRQTVHALPRPFRATSLATTTNDAQPQSSDLTDETIEPLTVAGHGVVIQPALHDTSQPTARFAQRSVHPLSQFRFDRL